MKKIVLSFLFSLFYFQLYASIPVENIFVDIDTNYKYYREVQELSDRGIIFPDVEGKLNPLKLLNRDEFVGISTEVTCKKCIQPDVDLEYIERYMGNQKYFDVDENNKYFYCISEADSLDQIKGYDVGQKCENGTAKEGERAFCPLNVITKEEAYAVILRNSKLWTIEQNKDLIDRIYSGENFDQISDDVGPKNIDGTPYTFYGYLNKALSFQLLEYDTQGNAIISPLLKTIDNKIYPKKALTKEEFIVMAYIALRSNNCANVEKKDEVAISLEIKDASCSEGKNNCKNLVLDPTVGTYDFEPESTTSCVSGIKSYVWRFYNVTTGEKIIKYEDYVDNFTFPSLGQWEVYLRAIDNCGGTSEVHSTISYTSGTTGKVDMYGKECSVSTKGTCTKIGTEGKIGENTYDFNGELEGGNIFKWVFKHRDTGDVIQKTGKYINDVVFPKDGVWDIELSIVDKDGVESKVNSIITVNTGATNTIVGKIDIYGKECSVSTKGTCTKIGTEGKIGESTYDFNAEITGGKGGESYTWKFINRETGEIIEKAGKYINDLKFPKDGVWDIELSIVDKDGVESKANSTINVNTGVANTISTTTGKIEAYGKECSMSTIGTCTKIGTEGKIGESTYDFNAEITGGKGGESYTWKFINRETGEIIEKAGKYINDLKFPKDGVWDIELSIVDKDGVESKINSIITVSSLAGVSVSIEANPISGNGPLEVDLNSIISVGAEIKEYTWNFGDGETSNGKNTTHVYDEKGTYEVELRIEDIHGNYFTATVNIYVDAVDCSIDIDNDGITDCEDKCIGVKGEKLNLGCPILEKKCDINGMCPKGYICSTSDPKMYLTEGICTIDTTAIGVNSLLGGVSGNESISKNCLYDTNKDTIYGNVVCNSCPCNLSIDYNASIRKCDVLFPAITSPDSKEIYSKGQMFLVK